MIYKTFNFIALCLLCATWRDCHAKTIKKAEANLLRPVEEFSPFQGKSYPDGEVQRVQSNEIEELRNSWHGKWFPHAPGESDNITDSWQGKWFPHPPGEPPVIDGWQGRWFPHPPYAEDEPEETDEEQIPICDDGKSQLSLDYDPEDKRHNYNYLCLHSNRSVFNPDLNTEGLLTEHFLPHAYVPPAQCMDEAIAYTHYPPTNGAFRPVPAVYGSYKYLPPQRYMRNLAEGAIVMVYHPCAYRGQVQQLENILGGCLYRHLVTPSQSLSPERPLALLSWSHSLSMSVVDEKQVVQFIKKMAKLGPLTLPNLSRVVEKRETYKADLLTEARLVTDLDDTELCGYLETHM